MRIYGLCLAVLFVGALAPDGVRAQSDTPQIDFFQAETGRGRPETAKALLDRLERQMAAPITGTDLLTGEETELKWETIGGRTRTLNCNTLLANHSHFGQSRMTRFRENSSRFIVNRCRVEDWRYVTKVVTENRKYMHYLRCRILEERRTSITEYLLYEVGRGTALDIANPIPNDLGSIAKDGAKKGAGLVSKATGAIVGAYALTVEAAVLGKLAYDARGRLKRARWHERRSRQLKELWKKSWDDFFEWEEAVAERVSSTTLPDCPPKSGSGAGGKKKAGSPPEDPKPPKVSEEEKKRQGGKKKGAKRNKTVGGLPIPGGGPLLGAVQALPWPFHPPGGGLNPVDPACFGVGGWSNAALRCPLRFGLRPGNRGSVIDRIGLDLQTDGKRIELCGGQRQRVGLARAVCTPCDVLLLDEPTTGLTFDRNGLQACIDTVTRLWREGETESGERDRTDGHTGIKVYVEGEVFASVPANDPKIGTSQWIDKKTGWGVAGSIYTPFYSTPDYEFQVGISGIGSWSGNSRLINIAPFPSSAFGGETDILALMLILGFEHRLTNELSVRGFGGFGGANVTFRGVQNGLTVVRGDEFVPAARLGLGAYYKVAENVDLGVTASYLWTGDLDTRTNTGVPLKLDGAQDLTFGITLRLDLDALE